MEYNSSNDDLWLYSSQLKPQADDSVLQEPVPFEDFKFSFGMDPDFSFPLESNELLPTNQLNSFLQDPFSLFQPATNTVLDENDQKTFSSFLDTFFIDNDMQIDHSLNNDYYDYNHTNAFWEEDEKRRNSILQSLDEQKKLQQRLNLIAALPTKSKSASSSPPVTCDLMTPSPSILTSNSVHSDEDIRTQSIFLRPSDNPTSSYKHISNKRLLACESRTPSAEQHISKKIRSNKELLTEEEKRANHIASEQKRRSTIRTGFKDLTELVPTLKNLNNSKSTVLFKSVEYIRYLEKRNNHLKEKKGSLELRVEVEGRMIQQSTHYTSSEESQREGESDVSITKLNSYEPHDNHNNNNTHNTIHHSNINVSHPLYSTAEHKQRRSNNVHSLLSTPISIAMLDGHLQKRRSSDHDEMNESKGVTDSYLQGLPTNTRNALMAHKSQQKQLLLLQEQLQLHQRLIAQQQEMKDKAIQSHLNKLPPILGQYDTSIHQNKSSLLNEMDDKAISAP